MSLGRPTKHPRSFRLMFPTVAARKSAEDRAKIAKMGLNEWIVTKIADSYVPPIPRPPAGEQVPRHSCPWCLISLASDNILRLHMTGCQKAPRS